MEVWTHLTTMVLLVVVLQQVLGDMTLLWAASASVHTMHLKQLMELQQVTTTQYTLSTQELVDGLDVGVGVGEKGETQDEETIWAKYVWDSLTFGYQRSKIDYTAAGTGDEEADHIGVSMAVNDNISVSIGRQTVDMGGSTAVDEESTGVSASYTMGSMTIKGHANKTDDGDGTSGKNDASKGLSLSFSF